MTCQRGKQVPGKSPFSAQGDKFRGGRKGGRPPRHVAGGPSNKGTLTSPPGRKMQEEFGEAIIGNNGHQHSSMSSSNGREMAALAAGAIPRLEFSNGGISQSNLASYPLNYTLL